jgi:hypothetical protein
MNISLNEPAYNRIPIKKPNNKIGQSQFSITNNYTSAILSSKDNISFGSSSWAILQTIANVGKKDLMFSKQKKKSKYGKLSVKYVIALQNTVRKKLLIV